jgi:apolipoprotein N-acyltransferase
VRVLPIAQLASVVGVYGVSALVAWVSAALALVTSATVRCVPGHTCGWPGGGRRDGDRHLGQRSHQSEQPDHDRRRVRVGLTQGNVDQAEKWNDQHANEIFQRYLQMSRQSAAGGAQFVLWPESAMPSIFGDDLVGTEQVRALARSIGVPILVGTDQIERGPASKYFNSAVLVRADGSTGAVYSKMHLVPFGEYVPLRRVFFFASRLVEAVSDFSPGESAVLLPVGPHQASTAICYEIVYPNLVRQSVASGSELLTTITNDAWFGPTSAPYQHFAQASMRAIENGRYLVRAANTGISGIVDPYGRVLAQTPVYEPAVVIGDARFLRSFTIYTRIGDLFAYLSGLATVALLVMQRPRRIR